VVTPTLECNDPFNPRLKNTVGNADDADAAQRGSMCRHLGDWWKG